MENDPEPGQAARPAANSKMFGEGVACKQFSPQTDYS